MLYELKRVGRTFERGDSRVVVLEEVSLRVDQGEFVAITGSSGAGKTSLLHVMGLLDSEFQGRMSFRGRSVANLGHTARARLRLAEIGFVFQGFHLLSMLNVIENVALPHWKLHGSRGTARKKAEELLCWLKLDHRLNHDTRRLSAGEMQRVALARALINEPPVILADEPTGNLDCESARSIIDLLRRIHEDGCTVILVSHSSELVTAAQRVLSLRYGRILDNTELDGPRSNSERGRA